MQNLYITAKGNRTFGWGTSGGESFNKFTKEGYFNNNMEIKRFYHLVYYWSAAQNTTNKPWNYKEQSIIFPGKSAGAVALHPGPHAINIPKLDIPLLKVEHIFLM